MNVKQNAYFFKQNAKNRRHNSASVFWDERKNMFSSYNYAATQAAALAYPFAHMAHMVIDSLTLLRGAALLTIAVFNGDRYAMSAVCEGLFVQSAAVVLDAIDCVLSAISILTRTFCTLVLGYAGNNSSNESSLVVYDMPMFGCATNIDLYQKNQSDDNNIYEMTYSFR